jgi:cytochrome c-type biogenesis protein
VSAILIAAGSALWLGILTSISPCPLASNVAALSFIGRNIAHPRRAIVAGIAYSLGRALCYVLVGALAVSSVLSIPSVSLFLQERMNQVLGPLLIVIGAAVLGWLRLPFRGWSRGESAGRRLAGAGIPGAAALGFLFALSFCPVSAGLFFGALIPLAIGVHSRLVIPAVYGLGTGLPVVAFALLLVLGARWAGRAFNALTAIERVSRPVAGALIVLAGIYLSLIHLAGLSIPGGPGT